jgi:uncharacterized protein
MTLKIRHFILIICCSLTAILSFAQKKEALIEKYHPDSEIEIKSIPVNQVKLTNSIFEERYNLNRNYVMSLESENLLQNFYFEAGLRVEIYNTSSEKFEGEHIPRPNKHWEDIHAGWEHPANQLRGHFLGHWLSSVAYMYQTHDDAQAKAKADFIVSELARCQKRNGGEWLGSIPEKYMDFMAEGTGIWAPPYTLHKTFMGLYDMYMIGGNEQALEMLKKFANWFYTYVEKNKDNAKNAFYNGESGGLLEIWANLYAITDHQKHLTLIERYGNPQMFQQLLAGEDPLTNQHTNTDIPWAVGAARVYEVTNDSKYKEIVEKFWEQAVTKRGMFATTGNNAGEYWIPSYKFHNHLSKAVQEHCTVYNMARLADFLFRWTGKSKYGDYIERAIYNGFLAQQNPNDGMISYFLPMEPGAHKVYGSKTQDFWCCHGSLVQVHTQYNKYIYYQNQNDIIINQFIPSQMNFETEENDFEIKMDRVVNENNWEVNIEINAEKPLQKHLLIRNPEWSHQKPDVQIDNKEVDYELNDKGFIVLNRDWTNNTIHIIMPKKIRMESLPGQENYKAFLDGPVVLAGLCDKEVNLTIDAKKPEKAFLPQKDHVYAKPWRWQWGHYKTAGQDQNIYFKPLFEICEENYSVYFPVE